MAFNIDYMGRVNTSANEKALRVWLYNGTSTGSNETLATVVASGYFNNFQQNLVSGNEAGPLEVNDVILVHGTDARGFYRVTSITTNVAVSDLETGAIDTDDIQDLAVTTAKIADEAVTAAKLAAAVAGNGLAGGAGNALSVNVDDTTIEIDTDALQVKDLGISTAKLAADAVDNSKLADDAVSIENLDDGIAPSHVVKFAGQPTTAGGAAAEVIAVAGALNTDLAFVQMVDNGTNNTSIVSAAVTADTLTVTFSADPGADAVINYQILRAAV